MPFQLPLLSLDVSTKAAKESVTRRWLEAVGERPTFPLWKRVGRRKHMWLHDLARRVEGYESAYEELGADGATRAQAAQRGARRAALQD